VSDRVQIRIYVNGRRRDLSVEPRRTLADALRDDCGLTGTHLGCEHGVCGTCTVLLDGQPVRSCLLYAVQATAGSIRTVEGLADNADELHPLQEAFWAHHGLQCGYCTPGFLMLAVSFLEQHPTATVSELSELLSANLCRCTGYQTILDSVLCAQQAMAGQRCPIPERHR
jgi:carbon-monoxide dehydrogenase small subunit